MHDQQALMFEALLEGGSLSEAARRCGISPSSLRAEIAVLGSDFGQPFLTGGFGDAKLTPAGEMVARWSQRVQHECEALRDQLGKARVQRLVAPLVTRRSVSPKRLGSPAPSEDDLQAMTQAALSAPDHGGLHPWRLIVFADAQRPRLAGLFEAEKRRRDPLASDQDLRRARDHATRAPALLAFVIRPHVQHVVPVREQWLGAGAALGNFLNAAHQLGYGAIVLSGERCHDVELLEELGIGDDEFLAGFISVGSVEDAPPARRPRSPDTMLSVWRPVEKRVKS